MLLSCAPSFCSSVGVSSIRAKCATYRTSKFAATMGKKLAVKPKLVVGVPLFQHGLETGSLSLASDGYAWFFVVSPFLQLPDNSFAQHLLFQPAQPFFHRLMSFQFDLNQWVLASSYILLSVQTAQGRPR